MRARPLAAAMLVLCASAPAAAQSVGAVVACTWSGPPAGDPFPNHKNVLSTPLVADLPYQSAFATEIVVVAYNGTDGGAYSSAGSNATYFGVLRVIDGQTCQQIDTIHDSSNPIIAAAVPAIGDLDNDGVPEIVALRALTGVVAFKWNSSLSRYQTWWVSTGSTISFVNRWDGLSIHDVNKDGYAEVVSSGEVFSGRTGERLNPSNTVSFLAGVGCTPVIADVDGDGAVELVAQRVYRWTASGWQIAYPMNVVGRHFAVADFGTPGATPADFDRTHLDGVAEVVVTGQHPTASLSAISLVTLGGQVVFRKTLDGVGGPPVIADVDGDGYPEIGVSGSNTYRVFDLKAAGAADPYVKWSKPIADSSSSSAGSAGFDFDGDGAMEIVSADQCFTRIFSGSTGAVVFSAPRWSCTWSEYPVVADTNGDGLAELVVSQNSNCQPMACPGTDPNRPTVARFGAALQGIQVFRGSAAWSPVRPIWNQQAYAITNVLDDGRIPAMPAWVQNFRTVGLNNFSVNGLGVAPDTTPPVITLNGGDPMTVEVGTAFVDPGATAVDEVAGPVPVTTSGWSTHPCSAAARDLQRVGTRTDPMRSRPGPRSDPGATAVDAFAGPVPVTTSGSVNTSALGTYTLTSGGPEWEHGNRHAHRARRGHAAAGYCRLRVTGRALAAESRARSHRRDGERVRRGRSSSDRAADLDHVERAGQRDRRRRHHG